MPSEARRRGAQNHHAIRAYDEVSSHHARGACEDQSLRDCSKWVRAKASISSQILNAATKELVELHSSQVRNLGLISGVVAVFTRHRASFNWGMKMASVNFLCTPLKVWGF